MDKREQTAREIFAKAAEVLATKGYHPSFKVLWEEPVDGDAYQAVAETDVLSAKDGPMVIRANPHSKYWDDPVAQVRFLSDKGFSSTDTPLHVGLHELAHVLYQERVNDNLDVLKRDPYLTILGSIVAAQVSSYARTAPGEFVADVFAGLMVGKTYSQEVMTLYHKLIGEKP